MSSGNHNLSGRIASSLLGATLTIGISTAAAAAGGLSGLMSHATPATTSNALQYSSGAQWSPGAETAQEKAQRIAAIQAMNRAAEQAAAQQDVAQNTAAPPTPTPTPTPTTPSPTPSPTPTPTPSPTETSTPDPSPSPPVTGGGKDWANTPFGVCVRQAEEGGSYAWGPGNGGGAYQFEPGTWQTWASSGTWGSASPAEQDQAFNNAVNGGDAAAWDSDGCPQKFGM